jgi:uncharacterized protein YdeI (YjbR/CyaY-like superfamily)
MQAGSGMEFDDWLLTQNEWTRDHLARLHRLISITQPHLRAAKKWGAWVFTGRGVVCSLSGFKHHMSIMFHRGVEMTDFHPLFDPTEATGLRSIRFTSIAELDLAAVREVVHAAAELDAAGPARREKKTPPPVETPAALTAALAMKKHAAARAFFDAQSPSCRREYCHWIQSAKRDDTKAARLEKTLELLHAGRRVYEPKKKK